jgi:hypothetical protein
LWKVKNVKKLQIITVKKGNKYLMLKIQRGNNKKGIKFIPYQNDKNNLTLNK